MIEKYDNINFGFSGVYMQSNQKGKVIAIILINGIVEYD